MMDRRVIWYNDIEGGFNIGDFSTDGVIDDYTCSQTTLAELLASLPVTQTDQSKLRFAKLVPEELRAPGTIRRRQTTYWTVDTRDGDSWRLHFREKLEFAYADAAFSEVIVASQHPLLVQYQHPWSQLFFSGTPADPQGVVATVRRAVVTASQGWRTFDQYANPAAINLDRFGVLMHGPTSLVELVSSILSSAGLKTRALPHVRYSFTPDHTLQALILGRSFVIANEFAFEKLNSPSS
jgi:hypothetical protein